MAAQREMREETGYEFKNWRLIEVLQPQSKMERFIYTYVASNGLQTNKAHLEAGERITVKKLPFDEAKQLTFDKVGYLGEVIAIFRETQNIAELLTLPEFVGQEVDR
jgi:8-oxo-dGTP pyrophosphatase MutT (NUDIX family)